MTLIKKSELKNLSKEEMKNKMFELKKKLIKLKTQVSRGTPPENPGKIRSLKRNIARILTLQKQKLETGGKK